MRSIDLIEFIKEARLGHITLSSSKDEIKKVFGQPKHIAKWGEGGKLDPVAWVYNDLYFGFHHETGETECIGFQSKSKKKVEPNIGKANIECHGLRNSIEVDEFERIMSGFDIFPKDRMLWDYYGCILIFSSGVEASFQGQLDKHYYGTFRLATNKWLQSDLRPLSPFVQKTAQKAPIASGS